ncbi:type I restriction enzyme, S subunit [Trichococcus flocculiformis]|nr:restriction endonuclease type i hsds [Trichococcus sp. ES5]SHF55213.1 type I restriction enzyme, S subunit [Trichococcus flocculiformis]
MAITGLEAAGTRGNCAKLGIDTTMNQSCMALFPKKKSLDSSFLFQWYRKVGEEYGLQYTQGTKQQSYNAELLKILPIVLPSVSEQVLIADFFDKIDDAIALHQRKLTLLEQLKQTYLQKLFPQSEKNIPALRFAGFSEHWEQRKLGDTVQITMGQSPNGENYTDNPRDHILVQGNADMKNGRVCPRVWTTQVTKKADPEDIILSVRAPVGDVGRTDYAVVLGRGVAGIKGNAFIFQTLSRMKEQGFWTRYSSGSTFESINSADLKDAFIQICHIEEQTKIGDFFTKLDDTIALHQSKLQKLAELKKTLLAKMLV